MTEKSAAMIATRALKNLTGKRCWYVVCGHNVGSSFSLCLGEMVKKITPPTLSAHRRKMDMLIPRLIRENDAELKLLVWTSWRISKRGKIVLTSSDCEDDAYPLKEQLRRRLSIRRMLKGSRVKSATITNPFYDLKIVFSNGYQLDVLCHRGNMQPSTDPRYSPILSNWDIFVPGNFLVKA